MIDALIRLREAEEANIRELSFLKKELQLEEITQQKLFQDRVDGLEEILAKDQTLVEHYLQQSLKEQKKNLDEENQRILDRYYKNMQRFQEQAVQQIVEGVIRTYGSNQIK